MQRQAYSYLTYARQKLLSVHFWTQPSRAHTKQRTNSQTSLCLINSFSLSFPKLSHQKRNVDRENPTHSICALVQRQTPGFLQSPAPPKLCRFLQQFEPFKTLQDPKTPHCVNVHHLFQPSRSLRQIFSHYPQQARRL